MKKDNFHKYLYAGVTAFLVVVCSILFFYVLYNTKNISNIFGSLISILKPFIIGAVVAYLLTPVSNWISRYVMRFLIRISGERMEDIVIRIREEEDAEEVSEEQPESAAAQKTAVQAEMTVETAVQAETEKTDNIREGTKQIPQPIRAKVLERLFFKGKKEESEFVKRRRKYKKLERMADVISIISSLLLAIAVIYLLLAMVIPEVMVSINGLIEVFPSSVSEFRKIILKEFEGNEQAYNYLKQFMDTINDNIEEFLTRYLLPNMQSLMTKVYSGIFSAIDVAKNILIGIIVSVYLMGRRRQFMAQGVLVLKSICSEKVANAILEELTIANTMFGGFIRGKLVDSLIIGIICFALMSVFRMPYALLISVIIGVTNIIPFFGPFIGAVPSAFLVLISDSSGLNIASCIYFLILILVLQQFDGNILGPKILGNSTGLSSFWVLFSILLFGGLFGVLGMVIGVPLFAVIYDLVKKSVEKSLAKKNKSEEMEKYRRRFHSAE